MKRISRCLGCLVLAIAASATIGCGDGRPVRHPIAGKVLIDGQPMTFGVVQVTPTGSRPAAGTIKEDGTFVLGSYGLDDGCVPGTHKVGIDGREPLGPTKTRWYAPKKYRFANSSGITLTVDGPRDDVVIEIDTGGKKPFEPYVEVRGRGRDPGTATDSVF